MADNGIYPGANYGLDSQYGKGDTFAGFGEEYRFSPGSFALATDPRTANQIKAVSDKLNTGAKTIEVTGITPDVLESIPEQHLDELRRLKELVGADLTLHGPIVEATGISRDGWDEGRRVQAERQMWSAVERGHKLDPDGNIIVTFHSTAGLPDMNQKTIVMENGKKVEKSNEIWVVDERDGKFNVIKPKENYLIKESPDPKKELEKLNEETWTKQVAHLGFQIRQGKEHVLGALSKESKEEKEEGAESRILELYKKYNTEEGQKMLNSFTPMQKKFFENKVAELNYGDIYVRDAYTELQELFNKAWVAVNKDGSEADKKKLGEYRDNMAKKVNEFKDPSKLPELAEDVSKGVLLLSTLSHTPEVFKPLSNFVVDKAAETFSGVALSSYKKFKNNSPIISIENPPAGGGLSRAEDLKELIEVSRNKFVDKAVKELGMSESSAREQANKIIGATWDVGHINMLRKFGYGDKELGEQATTIAPFLKHIHLSDNFGLEHTELPMGMGNVPMKEHLAAFKKQFGDKLDKIKKIVETGNWYQHFQKSPLRETFAAFGSPIYPMQMAPYWNQTPAFSQGYSAGYGMMLPEQHFQTYGAGFSMLPTELGGQFGGRSRLSGTPNE